MRRARQGDAVNDDKAVREAGERLAAIRGELSAAHRQLSELGAQTSVDAASKRAALKAAARRLEAGRRRITLEKSNKDSC